MKIIKGDMWGYMHNADAICIPVNGFVKRNGDAVIGRQGLAYYFNHCFNGTFSNLLGRTFQFDGPSVQKILKLKRPDIWVVAFPTKPHRITSDGTNAIESKASDFPKGKSIPGWAAKADLYTIAKSCLELKSLTSAEKWNTIYLPMLGTRGGERDWKTIEPILKLSLDERFIVVDYDVPY